MSQLTNYKNPSIEMIQHFNAKKDAWIISRPHLDHSSLDVRDLEKMDLPVNGFAQYVMHINSSILFRDLLFTLRPIVVWAKSNRTTPINNENMFISGEYESSLHDNSGLQSMFNDVYESINSGVPQDFAKKSLPMAANTEFTISIDDRTLVAFLGVLKNHIPSLFNVYGKLFLDAIGEDESYIEARHMADIYSKLSLSTEEYAAVGTTNEHLSSFVGVYDMSANLMSQFIRQHFSTIKNDLYNQVSNCGIDEMAHLKCDAPVTVALYADQASFRKVQSVRSCWFAQFDQENDSSWSSILKPYVQKMDGKQFKELLPCNGCASKCAIRADMEPRIRAGKVERLPNGTVLTGEINPPCPVLIEKPEMIQFREEKYKSDSAVFEAWKRMDEAGLINDNPDNSDRKEYEYNVEKYGLPE